MLLIMLRQAGGLFDSTERSQARLNKPEAGSGDVGQL